MVSHRSVGVCVCVTQRLRGLPPASTVLYWLWSHDWLREFQHRSARYSPRGSRWGGTMLMWEMTVCVHESHIVCICESGDFVVQWVRMIPYDMTVTRRNICMTVKERSCVCVCVCVNEKEREDIYETKRVDPTCFLRGFAPPINNSLRVFQALQCLQHLNVVRKQQEKILCSIT